MNQKLAEVTNLKAEISKPLALSELATWNREILGKAKVLLEVAGVNVETRYSEMNPFVIAFGVGGAGSHWALKILPGKESSLNRFASLIKRRYGCTLAYEPLTLKLQGVEAQFQTIDAPKLLIGHETALSGELDQLTKHELAHLVAYDRGRRGKGGILTISFREKSNHERGTQILHVDELLALHYELRHIFKMHLVNGDWHRASFKIEQLAREGEDTAGKIMNAATCISNMSDDEFSRCFIPQTQFSGGNSSTMYIDNSQFLVAIQQKGNASAGRRQRESEMGAAVSVSLRRQFAKICELAKYEQALWKNLLHKALDGAVDVVTLRTDINAAKQRFRKV